MKITLHSRGKIFPAQLPHAKADFVLVDECVCPHCKESLKAKGNGDVTHDFDTYYALAYCVSCGGAVGQIQTKVNTIFGIDEDNAVLNGRARVY